MAKAQSKAVPKGKEISTWKEKLDQQMAKTKAMEANSGGGKFVSIKGGILSYDGAAMPKNQMAVIVLHSILENVRYEGEYDADAPAGPVCFAFGESEADMQPHEAVVAADTAQSDFCTNCKWNEWGSAEKGRGKGCRNTRRLALVSAGALDKEGRLVWPQDPAAHFGQAEIGFFKLPVTSVKGWSGFVKQLEAIEGLPPMGMAVKVSLVPDQKTMVKVVFEALERVPDDLMEHVMALHETAAATTDFPYSMEAREVPAPKKPAARSASPTTSRRPAPAPARGVPAAGKKRF